MNFPSWRNYPSIYNLGHPAIESLLTIPVNVEEKVDGSQFSFGIDFDGDLHVRSKGAKMIVDAPEPMFKKAVATAQYLQSSLVKGWTYRCEFLAKPKHNSLSYSRIPDQHLVLFDVNTDEEQYMRYDDKKKVATSLGLECVPLIYSGELSSIEAFREFLGRESFLGGQQIEGVVIKPREYALFGRDKKCLMGKFVSEHFKEVHSQEWKKSNPTTTDVVTELGTSLCTPARWEKAVYHLRDRGELENSPRDIGKLLTEIQKDIESDAVEYIKQKLFDWAWPSIRRRAIFGFPEWYKERLLKQQFLQEKLNNDHGL